MKKRATIAISTAVLSIGVLACGTAVVSRATTSAPPPLLTVEVSFGPECESALLDSIKLAEHDVRVAIYSITRQRIRDALVEAVERGVDVQVKYDAESYEWRGMKSAIGFMQKRGVKCDRIEMSGKYAKMHHKFTVIDGRLVLTGSYNYSTTASLKNYENLVAISSTNIAAEFLREFDSIQSR